MGDKIPGVTIRRLPVYLRVLRQLQTEDVEIISSAELSRRTGFSSEQIRKDFAYFGAFGTRGVGYQTDVLRKTLMRILGLDKGLRVAIVGAGNLGTALARYNIERHEEIEITAVFDNDPEKVGSRIADEVVVSSADDMKSVVVEKEIKMGVLTVPPESAQQVADELVAAGVKALLNFTPVKLEFEENSPFVQNIDLSVEFQSLAYYSNIDTRET